MDEQAETRQSFCCDHFFSDMQSCEKGAGSECFSPTTDERCAEKIISDALKQNNNIR
jgi:hypothetical protein